MKSVKYLADLFFIKIELIYYMWPFKGYMVSEKGSFGIKLHSLQNLIWS